MRDKDDQELAAGSPDQHEHNDLEIDDCCGFDLDYWAEDISDDEIDDASERR